MRKGTLRSTLLLASTIPGLAAAQAVAGNWAMTWSDEFNNGASDLNGWSYDLGNNGGWGNNELEVYTNNSQNVFVSGGALHIDVISSGTGSYTSARIKTNALFSQTYGLFEFRAAFPRGQGLWPALWMMPRDSAYGGWPTSGEIDVFESKGQDTSLVQGSLHSGTVSGQDTQTLTYYQSGLEPPNFTTTAFHTYDLLWSKGSPGVPATISWYVDGIKYFTQTGGWVVPSSAPAGDKDAPFDKPFYIIMNMAVGGNYVGNPSLGAGSYDMQVDYVRVYQPAPPAIQGHVALGDYSGTVYGTPIIVKVLQPGTSTVLDTINTILDAGGNFSVATSRVGTFDVDIKASHWLSQVQSSVSFTSAGASGLNYSLINGDADGDNLVGPSDLNQLRSNFGGSSSMADLDGDGVVGPADLNIIRSHFGQSGN